VVLTCTSTTWTSDTAPTPSESCRVGATRRGSSRACGFGNMACTCTGPICCTPCSERVGLGSVTDNEAGRPSCSSGHWMWLLRQRRVKKSRTPTNLPTVSTHSMATPRATNPLLAVVVIGNHTAVDATTASGSAHVRPEEDLAQQPHSMALPYNQKTLTIHQARSHRATHLEVL
jgi:hypothetical protein